MKRLTSRLIVITFWLTLCILLTLFSSCSKENPLADEYEQALLDAIEDTTTTTPLNASYEFRMDGRCYQDPNGYYYLSLNESENQTLHRFGAYVTNVDTFNLPTQVIWSCESYWYLNEWTVPIINSTSLADPNMDSVFCMIAPVWEMQGDTITIYGQAWFEEGSTSLKDSINFIFE